MRKGTFSESGAILQDGDQSLRSRTSVLPSSFSLFLLLLRNQSASSLGLLQKQGKSIEQLLLDATLTVTWTVGRVEHFRKRLGEPS